MSMQMVLWRRSSLLAAVTARSGYSQYWLLNKTMWPLVISTVLGAILSAFLYPLVLWAARWFRSRDALRRVFQSSELTYVVPSYVRVSGRVSVRAADHRVGTAIGNLTRTEDSDDQIPFSFSHPAFPLVVIGSTRYNKIANDFQACFHVPFQFVIVQHDADPLTSQISILTEFGEELASSVDILSREGGVEVDYGILLIACLNGGKKFYWFAGIHSAGTEGVWQFARERSSKVLEHAPSRPGRFSAWLIRVRYEATSPRATIKGVEALGPPVSGILQQRNTKSAPKALLCDLGNVLMDFDRTRAYRAIAHYISVPWQKVRQDLENSNLREQYELGVLATEEFCDRVYSLLNIEETLLPGPLFKEFWSDIFWLNKEVAEALQCLRNDGVFLCLCSNTNPLHFQSIERDYPDVLALFSARVLSYETGTTKPEGPIFQRAIEVVRNSVPDCRASDMLVIDDISENVEAARGFGMQALLYRSYPHFVLWLREQGLYIP